MRVLIQRVLSAGVNVEGETVSRIGKGMLIFLGISVTDTEEDVAWLVKKIVGLRIFDDAGGIMNLDVRQTGGEVLTVSQFTLMASTKKGNRPSYIQAAGEEKALPLYRKFLAALSGALGREAASGIFGADMKVSLVNDGPVTIWMDSHCRE